MTPVSVIVVVYVRPLELRSNQVLPVLRSLVFPSPAEERGGVVSYQCLLLKMNIPGNEANEPFHLFSLNFWWQTMETEMSQGHTGKTSR